MTTENDTTSAVKPDTEVSPEPKLAYFYTTNYVHRYSAGPRMHFLNEDYDYIQSMDEAKRLAMKNHRGQIGHEDYCETSYGVMYPVEAEYGVTYPLATE